MGAVQLNPVLVLLFGLCMWSGFEYMSRSISHRQAIKEFKRTTEYKQNLKRLKEDTLADMERKGLVKRKMNGKRCVLLNINDSTAWTSVLRAQQRSDTSSMFCSARMQRCLAVLCVRWQRCTPAEQHASLDR